jgi:predicted transposase YdaD
MYKCPHQTTFLSGEFQWISRESDVLIRASSPEFGEFLVLKNQ